MTGPNNLPDMLTLPWVLAEPITASPAAMLQVEIVRTLDAVPELTEPERRLRNWKAVGLAVTFAWAAVAAVLMMTGAVFPVRGNVLAYLVMMAGLFCWAFLALAFPRSDDDLLVPPTAQCTPSRVTFTGRGEL